ncbi:MAG: pantoate--beta-alanine ligase [Phycisphaeraceae bacterium]|nr:pantoate--beta-alanine ligase [Phycisphaeraceae bacterium]MCW5753509.1 pantoate--beta-alanine ligase [Phycisphaeraceae bacterium]
MLVPTMGALHAGHAALIRQGVELARARHLAGGCVVSIFVNPTQFNDPSDYARYPRTLDADAQVCCEAGASAIFEPSVETIYPAEAPPPVPPLPRVATSPGLEDAFRPGHFAGVCQVVNRLFSLIAPHAAVFGEKDWQQLQVITAMSRSLGLPVEIHPGRTVREPDGLAMSSRNRFLKPEERTVAVAISEAMIACGGCETPEQAEQVLRTRLDRPELHVEYAVVRDAGTLESTILGGRPCRTLVAARIGTVRLIDNMPWPLD